MKATPELLRACQGYTHAVLTHVDENGYPLSVATDYKVDEPSKTVRLRPVPDEVAPGAGAEANVIVSHIRPAPGVGYDQRRYVNVWGPVSRTDDAIEIQAKDAFTWNEVQTPFVEYNEIGVRQGHHYLEELSKEQGRTIKPKLSPFWLFLRATRLPFLSATAIPVFLGIAIAALRGSFDLGLGLLTLLGASFIHLGLNVANDVFDTMSGADAANTTPTQFSGGSRVIHYGLLSLKQMSWMSAGFYAAGIAIGLWLVSLTGLPLLWLGLIGVAISIAYTAPPLRLVHRGIGEFTVALGFGPIVVLGASYVQLGRFTAEAAWASVPVAILIALVLYVNEIPDRKGDAKAGKRTIPVRVSKEAVINGYVASVFATYAVIAATAITGIIARPAIIALATIPLAIKVTKAMREHYDDPYALMPHMGTNIKLHAFTGTLLFAGYLIAIAADRLMENVPIFLR